MQITKDGIPTTTKNQRTALTTNIKMRRATIPITTLTKAPLVIATGTAWNTTTGRTQKTPANCRAAIPILITVTMSTTLTAMKAATITTTNTGRSTMPTMRRKVTATGAPPMKMASGSAMIAAKLTLKNSGITTHLPIVMRKKTGTTKRNTTMMTTTEMATTMKTTARTLTTPMRVQNTGMITTEYTATTLITTSMTWTATMRSTTISKLETLPSPNLTHITTTPAGKTTGTAPAQISVSPGILLILQRLTLSASLKTLRGMFWSMNTTARGVIQTGPLAASGMESGVVPVETVKKTSSPTSMASGSATTLDCDLVLLFMLYILIAQFIYAHI